MIPIMPKRSVTELSWFSCLILQDSNNLFTLSKLGCFTSLYALEVLWHITHKS